jgi:phage baseplate assembly protein W
MTGFFERDLTGFRFAETMHGDTIQRVAYRELGDASRWAELVWINDLVHPYITDDAELASDRVLLSGGTLIVPAAKAFLGASIDPALVFDTDCVLRKGFLEADESGDFQVVAGRDNLKQQLTHRIMTDKGALMFHPEYGCSIRRILGVVNGPTAALLGAEYVKSAMLSDQRVSDVSRTAAEVVGDVINISAEVRTISGRSVDLQATI